MTSKTKYIVIVLLLLVLATTSVGLSTWNIHYQAIVGDAVIKNPTFTQSDAESCDTQNSPWNDYIYFETTLDANDQIVEPVEQDYVIGSNGGNDIKANIFTYTYDGNTHTPAFFAPSSSASKGDENYPTGLFVGKDELNLDWAIGGKDGIFEEIEFKREYRRIAVPYVSQQHKGNSDNYCEISSINYLNDRINVTLNWQNGNNGNHKGTNVVVQFDLVNTVCEVLVEESNPTKKQQIIDKVDVEWDGQTATISVNGFSVNDFNYEYTIDTTNYGWTETAPKDAGVWQCRFTAVKNASHNYETEVTEQHKQAVAKAIAKLNCLMDSNTNYASQVTYAILPYGVTMDDLTEESFSYEEKKSAQVLEAPRRNLNSTMPLAEATETTTAESGRCDIDGNVNSFYVTYGGAGFEIKIESNFKDLNNEPIPVQFSTELLTDAKNLKELTENWDSTHYYTTYGFSPDPNYQIENPVIHYTILRREISIDSWTWETNEKEYTGEEQSPEVDVYTDTYGAELSHSWTDEEGETITKPKDVGSYIVWVSVGANYFLTCSNAGENWVDQTADEINPRIGFKFKITPKPIAKPTADTNVYTYNGSTQTYTIAESNYYTITGNTRKDAGDQTVTVTLNDTKNYVWADTDGETAPLTFTFTIAPKEINLTWADTSLTYNGSAQKPTASIVDDQIIEGDTVNITITTKLGDTVMAAKNVGSYTATAALDNTNYTASNPTQDFEINPKQVTKPTEDTNEFTYNGNTQTYDISSTDEYTVKGNTRKDAGDQDVTVALNDTKNYVWADTDGETAPLTFTFTIAPKEITLTWGETNLTYTGNVQVPTASIADGQLVTGDTCTVSVETDKESKNVGSYTATATLDNTNYTASNPTQDFEIAKKQVSISWPNISLQYNGTAQAPTPTVNGVVSGDKCTVDVTTDGDCINVGTGYTATVESINNDNYVLTASSSTTFEITPKAVTISWSATTFFYDGTTKAPTASTNDILAEDAETCVLSFSGSGIDAKTYNATATLTGTSAGNYTIESGAEIQFIISRSANEVVWGDELTWTFGQKPATLPQIATAKFGGDIEITFLAFDEQAQTYSIPTTFDAITNAGNYYVAVTTSDDSLGSNFYGVTDGKVFKVEKATNTVTFDDGMPKGWTYGQKPADQTSVVSATSLFETQSITITFYSDETYTTAIEFANIVNAGTYYVKATSAETDNYAPGEAKASFAVAKGTYDMSGITFEAVEVEYTGSPINIYIKGTLPNGVSVSYVGNGKTNVADSGTVTANFTTTDSNYNAPAPMSATLTITRKKIAKPAVPEGTTFTYNGDDQTTTILAALGYDENTMTFRAASNAFINAGSKDIDFTPNANHCWNDGTTAEFRLSISIGELQVYVKSNILQFDYNTNGVTWDNLTSNIAATTAVVQGTALVSSIKYTNTTDAESTTLTAGGAIKVGSTYKIVYTVPNTNIELIGKNYCYLKYKTAKVDGAYYTIEDALATSGTSTITFEGNSSKADTYIHTMFSLIQDGTVPELSNITLDYTLTSGRTLIVPFENSTNANAQDGQKTSMQSSNVYSALTIPAGAKLTIPSNAKLYVGGRIYYWQPQTTVTGIHGVLVNNGTIDVQSGGTVKSYGYIKGIGTLNLLSGSSATDCLHTYDWPGGSAASNIYTEVFPTNAWSFHNIACPTKIYAGAQYRTFFYVIMSKQTATAEPVVIGTGSDSVCLFQPSGTRDDSYIFKYTTNATNTPDDTNLTTIVGSNQIAGQKDILEMHGDYSDSNFDVDVSVLFATVNLKTSTTISLPTGFADIHIKSNGNVTLSHCDYLFMPGTKLVVDEGCTLTTTNGVDINFALKDDIESLGNNDCSYRLKYVDKFDAYGHISGTLIVGAGCGISGELCAGSANAFLDLSNAKDEPGEPSYKMLYTNQSPYFTTFGDNDPEGDIKTAYGTIKSSETDIDIADFSTGNGISSIYVATSDGSGGYIWTVTQEEALSYTITTVWSTGERNTTTYRYFASDGAPTITPSTLGDLSKDYYDFDGWYTDSGHTDALDSQTVAADGSYTFYAKFTPTTYNVTYKLYSDTLGGTELDTSTLDGFVNGSSDSYSVVRALVLAKATCGDMTFDGWYIYNPLAQEGEDPYIKLTDANNLPITVAAGTTFGGYTLGKDLTDFELVGTLKNLQKFTVTYLAQTNDATDDWIEITTEIINEGNTIDQSLLLNTFATQENMDPQFKYYFDTSKWYYADGTSYNSSAEVTNNLTLYAKRFEKESFTVTYNANGGSTTESYTGWVKTGGTVSITLPAAPTRTGYTFTGWYPAASGGTSVGGAGESYSAGQSTTLYAQWQINSYTITVKTSNATVKVNGNAVSNNGTVSIQYGTQVTVEVTYDKTENQGTTITGTDGTTYTSPFNMPAQDVTINASSQDSCFAPGTLITMADGSLVAIENLKPGDFVLSYDFETGAFVPTIVAEVTNHGIDKYQAMTLRFDDNSTIKIIAYHGFFDVTEMRYLDISVDNYQDYIGHEFMAYDGNGNVVIKRLVSATVSTEQTSSYSLTAAVYINAIADGLITITPPMTNWYNMFDVDGNFKWNEQLMAQDIDKYGLFTYAEVESMIPYEIFVASNFRYFKVAMAKGLVSMAEIEEFVAWYNELIESGEIVLGDMSQFLPPQENTNTTDAVEATLPPPVVTGTDDNSGDGDGDSSNDDTSE